MQGPAGDGGTNSILQLLEQLMQQGGVGGSANAGTNPGTMEIIKMIMSAMTGGSGEDFIKHLQEQQALPASGGSTWQTGGGY